MKKLENWNWLIRMTFLFILINACKEDHDSDTSLPQVVISAPGENSFTDMGDPLPISANVTDNSIHEVNLQIKSATDSLLFTKTYNAHDKTSFGVSETWTVPRLGTAPTEITILITAEDHSKNKGSASRVVSVFPK
ncbi:MAG: hypothetical protein IPH93_08590 [Saprospiraceae bacterium]|nr:hypothetical protein [Saprospiraceae bacterium]MBK7810554.1 hypothetical protein [Saprospiraceae bacterium]MBK9630144.1 hypothetical protein [Saprospiraceae bacterium]